jgi:hypothetical protein
MYATVLLRPRDRPGRASPWLALPQGLEARRLTAYLLQPSVPVRLPTTGHGPTVMFHRLLERVAELRVYQRTEGTPADRAAWGELLDQLLAAPEVLVATCAYCARLRTPDGQWRAPGPELRAALVEQQRLSHTYCPDCLHARGLE